MNLFSEIGRYIIFMKYVFKRPERGRVFWSMLTREMNLMGIESLVVVILIALITGAVTTVQTASQLASDSGILPPSLFPMEIVGSVVGSSSILEIAPTITCLVLAGKIGANIASEIGNMRVSEQIDAYEVMGINSVNYLVFPKTIALLLYPFVISIAMFLGIIGGMAACVFGGYATFEDYVTGIQTDFTPFHMAYAFIKTIVFAFLLATIPAFHGYYMKGGALEVGKASTTAFVWTSVAIILLNYILTQMLLS